MREGFALWANPSSPHAEGRRARAALEDARARIKAALGWEGELIFTSGASEALAIGLGRVRADRRLVSVVEHDSVLRAAPDAEPVPLDAQGGLDLGHLEQALARGGPSVLGVQTLNPETGTFVAYSNDADSPLMELLHRHGGLLLQDCAQSAGKEVPLPCADMAVVSAHKLGGPIGIGALLVRDFAMLVPSGGQERGYRAGTENLPAALGFAAAVELGGKEYWKTTAEERWNFLERYLESGEMLPRGPFCDHILALTHPSLSAQALLIRLDAMGIAVSAGSACSSGSLKPSRVLKAFGFDDATASRTIRVSIGWNTTTEDLAGFADAWHSFA